MASAFADRDGAWVDRMPADGLTAALRAAGDAYQELRSAGQGAHEILATLSKADGVLVPAGDPTGGRSVPYLFLHRTFHEYLVARHLSRQPTERWMQTVEAHRWFEPDWDEVIAMLAGLLPDPAPLLRLFVDGADDPFHASLSHAARAVAELQPEQARRERTTGIVDRLVELLHGPHPDREVAVHAFSRLVITGNPHAIAELRAQLDSADPTARWAAAEALAGTTDPLTLANLIARLNHPDHTMRQAAARALAGTIDPQALAGLIARLNDPDHRVRSAAAEALKGTTDPQALAGLIAQLDDLDHRVRSAAAEALKGTTDPQTVARLIRYIRYPDPQVYWAAGRALVGTAAGPHVLARLIAQLNDTHHVVWALKGTAARKP